MAEPQTQGGHRNAGLVMERREGLAELVESPFAADRLCGAAMAALVDALATIEPGAERQILQNPEEVAIGFTIGAGEDEHRSAAPLPLEQGIDEGVRDRDRSLFVILYPKAHLRLGTNLYDLALKVDILPGCVHHLLLAQSGQHEELEHLKFFGIGGREERLQLIGRVRLDLLFVIPRLVGGTQQSNDAVRFKQCPDTHDVVVDSAVTEPLLFKEGHVIKEILPGDVLYLPACETRSEDAQHPFARSNRLRGSESSHLRKILGDRVCQRG